MHSIAYEFQSTEDRFVLIKLDMYKSVKIAGTVQIQVVSSLIKVNELNPIA